MIAGAALLREKPLWSGGPGVLELEDRNGHDKPETQRTHSMDLTPPSAKTKQPLQDWLSAGGRRIRARLRGSKSRGWPRITGTARRRWRTEFATSARQGSTW